MLLLYVGLISVCTSNLPDDVTLNILKKLIYVITNVITYVITYIEYLSIISLGTLDTISLLALMHHGQ